MGHRTLITCTLAFACATGVHAGDAQLGTFAYGIAEPVAAPRESRYAHLSFEFEHCGSVVRSRWFDAAHVLLAYDELEAPNLRLERYRLWRPNIEERSDVKRAGSELSIERQNGAVVRTAKLTVGENISAGPMLVLEAINQRQQIESGTSLQVNYVVPEQLAAYDLNLGRLSQAQDSGVLVTASSWMIRPFMHPVEMYFNAAGDFIRMRGRILPFMGTSAHPEPIEADTRVIHTEQRTCSSSPQAEEVVRR